MKRFHAGLRKVLVYCLNQKPTFYLSFQQNNFMVKSNITENNWSTFLNLQLLFDPKLLIIYSLGVVVDPEHGGGGGGIRKLIKEAGNSVSLNDHFMFLLMRICSIWGIEILHSWPRLRKSKNLPKTHFRVIQIGSFNLL